MDEKQLNSMLSLAAGKLGMDKSELMKAVKSGDTNTILSHLDKDSAEKIDRAVKSGKAKDILSEKLGK